MPRPPSKPPARSRTPAPGTRKAPEAGPLERAIALLNAFVDGQEQWGVRELAAATGEPTSTTHRLLARMRDLGWLDFDEARKRYRVGFELYRIGAVLSQRHRVGQAALPVLEGLVESLGESAWLCLHDERRARVAWVTERAAPNAFRLPAPVGNEEPLWSDPAGWAILAALGPAEAEAILGEAPLEFLPREALRERVAAARGDGFCAGPGARVVEAMVVAAAVRDAAGQPCASLCVAVPRHRVSEGDTRRLGIAVRDAARRLSYLMGATLLAGASAGSWHDAAAAISSLMRRHSPALAVSPALGGGRSNLEDLQQGRAAYCLTTAASLEDAFHGRDGVAHPRLAAVMALSALYLHVFTRPGVRVRTVRDLAGLRVSPGAEGFSSERLFHELLADAGVKSPGGARREGHILRLDYPEGRKMLLAGKVDALFWLTGRNNALCRELAATPTVGRPPLPENALAQFAARHPGYQMATLQARGPAIPTLKVPTVLATVIDRPEDEVYRLAKVVHESRHELAFEGGFDEGGDAAGPCSADIPMHPGALRYWEEAGLAGRRDRAKAP